mmetsp:Transcript_22004/g.42882  ORF Transcript_22004/g.42882 Transcript_22004/m.42882 type:complete len:289 (-) Transcript_22004:401-1267(-)
MAIRVFAVCMAMAARTIATSPAWAVLAARAFFQGLASSISQTSAAATSAAASAAASAVGPAAHAASAGITVLATSVARSPGATAATAAASAANAAQAPIVAAADSMTTMVAVSVITATIMTRSQSNLFLTAAFAEYIRASGIHALTAVAENKGLHGVISPGGRIHGRPVGCSLLWWSPTQDAARRPMRGGKPSQDIACVRSGFQPAFWCGSCETPVFFFRDGCPLGRTRFFASNLHIGRRPLCCRRFCIARLHAIQCRRLDCQFKYVRGNNTCPVHIKTPEYQGEFGL